MHGEAHRLLPNQKLLTCVEEFTAASTTNAIRNFIAGLRESYELRSSFQHIFRRQVRDETPKSEKWNREKHMSGFATNQDLADLT